MRANIVWTNLLFTVVSFVFILVLVVLFLTAGMCFVTQLTAIQLRLRWLLLYTTSSRYLFWDSQREQIKFSDSKLGSPQFMKQPTIFKAAANKKYELFMKLTYFCHTTACFTLERPPHHLCSCLTCEVSSLVWRLSHSCEVTLSVARLLNLMWSYLTVVRLAQQFWGCLTPCKPASLPARLHHPLWYCHTHYDSVWQLQGHLIKVSGETASQLWGCLSRCEAEFIVVMLPHQFRGCLFCCQAASSVVRLFHIFEVSSSVVSLPLQLWGCFIHCEAVSQLLGYLIGCEVTSLIVRPPQLSRLPHIFVIW